MKRTELPFVSVIIPFKNAQKTINSLISALKVQTYPKDRIEFIFVNDKSTDDSCDFLPSTSFKLIHSDGSGSYAARNLGASASKGEILLFTDADCTPDPQWVETGIQMLQKENADLLSGEIRFKLSKKHSSSEIYDSISFLQSQQGVRFRQVAFTANLFVKRAAFYKLEGFDSNLKSGADILFSRKATQTGLRLIYGAKARIWHPTRNFSELTQKSIRVGLGKGSALDLAPHLLYSPQIALLFPWKLTRRLEQKNYSLTTQEWLKTFALAYWVVGLSLTAFIAGSIMRPISKIFWPSYLRTRRVSSEHISCRLP